MSQLSTRSNSIDTMRGMTLALMIIVNMSISEEKNIKKDLIVFLPSEYSEIKMKSSHSDGKSEIVAEVKSFNELKELNTFNEN